VRIFPSADGAIDRKDRAGYLTPPFDAAYAQAITVTAVPLTLGGLSITITIPGTPRFAQGLIIE